MFEISSPEKIKITRNTLKKLILLRIQTIALTLIINANSNIKNEKLLISLDLIFLITLLLNLKQKIDNSPKN